MSVQIAVRLPEEMVMFLDEAVKEGRATSRASLVAVALDREMRRFFAERDANILKRVGAADDLDDLVQWTTSNIGIED